MIPASAQLEVAWVDPATLVPYPPQVLDLDQVRYYMGLLQKAEDEEGHLAPPMVNANSLTFRDGRHRWLAHLALGRSRMRVLLVHGAEPCSSAGS